MWKQMMRGKQISNTKKATVFITNYAYPMRVNILIFFYKQHKL